MSGPCSVDGCDREARKRGWCNKHYDRWRRGKPVDLDPISYEDGPGVCICPVSYPAPKCCTKCGFPCVHRMAPHIRGRALTKKPSLRDQVVLGLERGAA